MHCRSFLFSCNIFAAVLSRENNVIKGVVMYKRNAMFLGPNARMDDDDDDDDVSWIPLPNA